MTAEKKDKTEGTDKIKIMVVDDHSIVRQGLSQLLNQEGDITVCAEAENAYQALEFLEKEHIDLAIVDISM